MQRRILDILKVQEIADGFGVHRNTITNWLKDGVLKDRSLASIIDLVHQRALIAGKEDCIADLKSRGWLRKEPWPSRKHQAGESPWVT